jgi:hypothetical protein
MKKKTLGGKSRDRVPLAEHKAWENIQSFKLYGERNFLP